MHGVHVEVIFGCIIGLMNALSMNMRRDNSRPGVALWLLLALSSKKQKKPLQPRRDLLVTPYRGVIRCFGCAWPGKINFLPCVAGLPERVEPATQRKQRYICV